VARVSAPVSPREAWELLRGKRVLTPPSSGQPVGFLRALADLPADYEIEIVSGIQSGGYDFLECAPAGVRFTTWQLTPEARRLPVPPDFRPMRYSQLIPAFSAGGAYPVDAVVVHVSPPDADGLCSMGVSPSLLAPLAAAAPEVVAVVNARMPDTTGHRRFPLDRAIAVVALDEPIADFATPTPDDVDRAIATHLATLVPDEATVQFGLGGVPGALPELLTGHTGIRVYGMLTDACLPLVMRGGPHEIGEVMGTQALYDFVDHNSDVRLVSSDEAMAPERFRRMPRFVAVNSAVQVDLMGQVCAESVGTRVISGPGGQLDYMEGAMLSPGGMAIVALRATAPKGESRIVATLDPGWFVTTPHTCVTHVVTEHGIADLRGRSIEERRRQLATIAAPEFRDDLLAWAPEGRR
jgi:acyl-CoA hydrolase